MAKETNQPGDAARALGIPPATDVGQARPAISAAGAQPPSLPAQVSAQSQPQTLEQIQRELAEVKAQLAQQRAPDVMHASALVSAQAQERQLDRVRPGGYYQIGDRFVDANGREVEPGPEGRA